MLSAKVALHQINIARAVTVDFWSIMALYICEITAKLHGVGCSCGLWVRFLSDKRSILFIVSEQHISFFLTRLRTLLLKQLSNDYEMNNLVIL